MNMKQSKLKVDSILEYYDNPQLLTARDCFDTLYLCLLYEDTPECKYTAIRISSKRLQDFCMGKKDLRSLFLSPEGDKEYFNVRGADNNLVLDLKINTTIPEDRLPDIIRKTKCFRILERNAKISKTKRNFSRLYPTPQKFKKIDRLRRNEIHLKAVRTSS